MLQNDYVICKIPGKVIMTASGLLTKTDEIFSLLRKLSHNPCEERTGGYLSVYKRKTSRLIVLFPLGKIPAEKEAKYQRCSLEKGRRLCEHPDDVSSFQSHDDAHEQYPGAIGNDIWIISFSGLPWQCDEALTTVTAYHSSLINYGELCEISKISQNNLIHQLHEKAKAQA